MLRIFENIRPVSALYILLIGLILRIPAILNPPAEAVYSYDPAILRGLFSLLNQNYIVSVSVGLLVIFLQAVWFNKLCIDHDVIYTHSYLPGYFFMILNSVFPQSLVFHPIMLINFCVIAAFMSLYNLHQGTNSAIILYYAGLFLGLASLILPVLYVGMVFLIVTTIIFKNINIKDFFGIVTGYIFAGMIAAGIYFLAGSTYHFPKLNYKIDISFAQATLNYPAMVLVFILTIAALVKAFINYSKNNIKTRRITLLMIAYLLFSLVIMGINSGDYSMFFPLMSLSLGVLLAYLLIGKKHKRGKEFLHYLLLIAVVWSLYGSNIKLF